MPEPIKHPWLLISVIGAMCWAPIVLATQLNESIDALAKARAKERGARDRERHKS